jgi:hypothetical protein
MAKAWLEERLSVLIPALQALDAAQEAEIARLCEEEIATWKQRPAMKKATSLRPVMTATRNAIRQRLTLTPENRWKNLRNGQYEHIALRYMNFSPEEWDAMNALSDEKFEERQRNQRLINNPQEIIARAEKLLHSDRWDDLVVGLALTTGRRLTELLKTGRFFPKGRYMLVFDGQLKRRDLGLKPYEIPVLVDAELVLTAWRRLRSLEDTSKLEIEAIPQKYSRAASENANRVFTGLIPQRVERENLYTHSFRAVYARIAVLWFCPVSLVFRPYASTILGHYHARDEKQQQDALTTEHYFDYAIGDGQGNIDGRQGIRLSEPGVEVLEVFKKGKTMSSTTETQDTQEQEQPLLETKARKTRGTITTKPGSFDLFIKLMRERNMRHHDELVVDLMAHDAIAHQMYALLQPLAEELEADAPIATLQALIAAYRAGGGAPQQPGMAELFKAVSDEEKPVEYLKKLVKRDRDFQAAIANRHSTVDYSTASMEDLRFKFKTAEAATERFRRAVEAIIKHNNAQTDPLHLWYINAAMVRKLVGGKNELVQAYLKTRDAEIKAHHDQYNLTAKQNDKNADIAAEIIVE